MPDERDRPIRGARHGASGSGRSGGSGRGGAGGRGAGRSGEEPGYRVYRAAPRGLRERLRGEDPLLDGPQGARPSFRGGSALAGAGPELAGAGRAAGVRDPHGAVASPARVGASAGLATLAGAGRLRRLLRPRRLLAYLVAAVALWVGISAALFLISAQSQSGSIPQSALRALAPAGNMLTSADTILVLGTDQRPRGTHEAGANTSDRGSRTDTIMLWRIGGGVSRRLSIPRDTLINLPGYGEQKINAAYAFGGPALAIGTIERFTGIRINHVIIVNLANFPRFIDAIGGITVRTGRICSNISGGARNGGFSLFLRPGVHHLDGIQALTLARTRDNSCNPASSDLTREGYQQEILNAIKAQLLTPATFLHLPWASWYAPQAVRTDMGPLTLMSLFVASELGGSAPTRILYPSGSAYVPGVGDSLIASRADVRRAVATLMGG